MNINFNFKKTEELYPWQKTLIFTLWNHLKYEVFYNICEERAGV